MIERQKQAPLDIYLNDHLAAATGAADLAERARADHEGTPLQEFFAELAGEIKEDRRTLADLVERLRMAKDPVKQASSWVMEKLSTIKLSRETSGEPGLNRFLTLETLYLGVEGKICLWRSLKRVASEHDALASTNFDALIKRAEAQRSDLEREWMAAMSVLRKPAPR